MNMLVFLALITAACLAMLICLGGYLPPFGRQRQIIQHLLLRLKKQPNFGNRDFRIEYELKRLETFTNSSRQQRAYEQLCDEYGKFVISGLLDHLEVYLDNGDLQLSLSKIMRLREFYPTNLGGPAIYLSPMDEAQIERIDRAEKLLLDLLQDFIDSAKTNPHDLRFQGMLSLASRCSLTYYPPNWNEKITDYIEAPEYADYAKLGDFDQYTPTAWLLQAATALTESNVQRAMEIIAICTYFSEDANEVPGLSPLLAQLALLVAQTRAAQSARP